MSDLTEPSDSASRDPSVDVAPTDVVAIDGPSGAGKSTIARTLAERLGYGFLDTGAMYRAITWHFLQCGAAPSECAGQPDRGHAKMKGGLAGADLALRDGVMLLNGKDVTAHLRTREVESQVSAVSALPFVRSSMGDLQRMAALQGPPSQLIVFAQLRAPLGRRAPRRLARRPASLRRPWGQLTSRRVGLD